MTPGWLNVRFGLTEAPPRRRWRPSGLLIAMVACALFWVAVIWAGL